MTAKHDAFRHHLETQILTHTLIFITSLLVLFLALWHISSAHLVDNMGMPEAWRALFLKAQFRWWKTGFWSLIFFLVPLDLLHALLSVDFYHGCLHKRGKVHTMPTSVAEKSILATVRPNITSVSLPTAIRMLSSPVSAPRKRHHNRTLAKFHSYHSSQLFHLSNPSSKPLSPKEEPHTYHPLHHPSLSTISRFWLQTLFDALMITLLACHITTFATSFLENMSFCKWTNGWPVQLNDPRETWLSVHDRCVRINIDMHVAGGFDAGMCAILGGMHSWCLVYRAWALVQHYDDRTSESSSNSSSISREDFSGHDDLNTRPDSPYRNLEHSRSSMELATGNTVKFVENNHVITNFDDEKDTSIPYRDRHSKRRQRMRGSQSASSEGVSRRLTPESYRWSEVLLECLVP